MARHCDVCGKGSMSGHRISHAHNLTKRKFNVNLRPVRAKTTGGNGRRIRVCTRCLRSGVIAKA